MIGLDTNVLLRYVVQDDPRQAKLAASVIEQCTAEAPGFVNLVVLVEFVWVLGRRYGYDRAQIASVVLALLMTPQIQVAQRDLVAAANTVYRAGRFDFSDIVIALLNREAGCTETRTFDAGARTLMSLVGARA